METRAVICTAWLPVKLDGRWRWLVPHIRIDAIQYDDSGYTQGGFWVTIERRPLP